MTGCLIFELFILLGGIGFGSMNEYAPVRLICFTVDRFDGRALLDFIRDTSSRHFRVPEKSEEEEELEEFVNFERYRDLIKHRRRGCRYFFEFSIIS